MLNSYVVFYSLGQHKILKEIFREALCTALVIEAEGLSTHSGCKVLTCSEVKLKLILFRIRGGFPKKIELPRDMRDSSFEKAAGIRRQDMAQEV